MTERGGSVLKTTMWMLRDGKPGIRRYSDRVQPTSLPRGRGCIVQRLMRLQIQGRFGKEKHNVILTWGKLQDKMDTKLSSAHALRHLPHSMRTFTVKQTVNRECSGLELLMIPRDNQTKVGIVGQGTIWTTPLNRARPDRTYLPVLVVSNPRGRGM